MKSKATDFGSISIVFSSIVLLWVSSIIIIIIIIMIKTIIIIITITIMIIIITIIIKYEHIFIKPYISNKKYTRILDDTLSPLSRVK